MEKMRVTSWHRLDKLTNNQETRGVGSRQLTWEHTAHRNYDKSHVLTQNKNTSTWPAKQNHSPCAKRDMNTQLIRRLINHVFTQNMTNVKAHSQWKTQAACHTEKDQIRESKMNAHGQRSARPERIRDPTLPQQDQTWSVSVRTPTRNQNWAWNKTRVSGSEHHAPTWTRARRQESTLEAALSPENKTRRESHKTMNKLARSDRTLIIWLKNTVKTVILWNIIKN